MQYLVNYYALPFTIEDCLEMFFAFSFATFGTPGTMCSAPSALAPGKPILLPDHLSRDTNAGHLTPTPQLRAHEKIQHAHHGRPTAEEPAGKKTAAAAAAGAAGGAAAGAAG